MHKQEPIGEKKVYLNKNKEGHFNCGECGKAQKLSAREGNRKTNRSQ